MSYSQSTQHHPEEFLILIADDEPNIRFALKEFLSEQGYRVQEAEDGEEAYQLYEYIYLKSVDNYYHHNKEDDDLDAVAPALFCGVLSPFIIAGIISILKNFVGAIVSAGSAGG